MTRMEFIEVMEVYVEKLNKERKELKSLLKAGDEDCYFMLAKNGHEISAIENAIREMKRQ